LKPLFDIRALTRFSSLLRRFGAGEGGNTMVIFGLSAFVLFGAVGGAIDFSRVDIARKHLQDAADAALLRTMSMSTTATDAQRQTAANAAFDENFNDTSAYGITRTLLKETSGNTINQSYKVTANVTSYFSALIGLDHFTVNVVAKAQSQMQKSEIALVLDSTGSMSASNKMTNLKSSMDSVLASLLNSSGVNQSGTKVAIVPFNTQVKLTAGSTYTYIDYGTETVGESCKTSGTFSSSICSIAWDVYDKVCVGVTDMTTCRANGQGWYTISAADSAGKTWYTVVYKSYVGSTTYTYTEIYYSTTKTTVTAPYYYTDETGTHYNAGGTSTSTSFTYSSQAKGTPVTDANHTTYNTSPGSTYTKVPAGGLYFSVSNSNGYGAALAKTTTSTSNGASRTYVYPAAAETKASWGGCVIDRTQPYDTQADAPVTTTPATLYPARGCTNSSLQPVQGLSDNIATARAFIKTLSPGGNTNVTIGVQWGMEVLSPSAPFTGGVAFKDETTHKYMIVVTDGDNTQNRFTSTQADIDKRTALACTNAKNAGITVFVIKVIEGNSDMLRACASRSDYFYDLTSAAQINTALSAVFEAIKKTRLTQ